MKNTKLEGFKFRVPNEYVSALIQEVLFSFGYRWGNSGGEMKTSYTDKPYLYAEKTGWLGHGTEDFTFSESENKEIEVKHEQ